MLVHPTSGAWLSRPWSPRDGVDVPSGSRACECILHIVQLFIRYSFLHACFLNHDRGLGDVLLHEMLQCIVLIELLWKTPPRKGEREIRVTQRGCTDTAGGFYCSCRVTPPAPNIGGERALPRRIGSILKGGEEAAHRATVRLVACLPPRCCRGPVR